jgi:hypothetical protein
LEKANDGMRVSEDFLNGVIKQRLTVYNDAHQHLAKSRIGSPLTDHDAQKPLEQELQTLFISTFCVKGLEGLRREVVTHMQCNAIALSRGKEFKNVELTGTPAGWEFRNKGGVLEECSLKDWDYEKMKKVYKCDLCESFWSKGWNDRKWTDCRACKKFRTAESKPFDASGGISSSMPDSPAQAFSSAKANQNPQWCFYRTSTLIYLRNLKTRLPLQYQCSDRGRCICFAARSMHSKCIYPSEISSI